VPILVTSILGAAAFALSEYFWSPETVEVPAYAWIIGGAGLAAAAVGVGLALGDEHCGPERFDILRPPCRTIRADELFGVEVAMTALPLVTFPLAYLLRGWSNAVSVSLAGDRSGMTLTASLKWL
jgi:hypothetical protein